MTWLGGWLREIILVVLLASFVEMLLPSKSMERYARLVLSLLVLLTMLSPIVSMLKGDAVSELSMAMEQQNTQDGIMASVKGGADTLEQILADGAKLARGQQEQSLKLAASEIAGQMKEQITAETGKRGIKVTVALAMEPANGPGGEAHPAISSVIVSMPADLQIQDPGEPAAADQVAEEGSASEPIEIPPVDTIEVNVHSSGEGQTGNGTAGEVSAPGTEAAKNQAAAAEEAKAIMAILEQQWGIDPEVVHVQSGLSGAAKL